MVIIIKKEVVIEESLKKKLELICEFSNTTLKIINGSIRKIDKTNLSYIEPHKIIGNFQKIYILIKYLVIKLLNQFKMIIFGIKKMTKIKTKKKMITKLVCNHLLFFKVFLMLSILF